MEELRCILDCKPTAEPVSPDPRAQGQRLRLRDNVTYIVAGVLFEGDKLLLIQEAKPGCRGDWYLPAGRMEPNETIVEAVKREVEEESGLTFEPESVIAVECLSKAWIRITLSGRVTGGSLKTTAQADRESLQAGWFSKEETTKLRWRARDVFPLIETGRKWAAKGKRFGGLPVAVRHGSASMRLVLVNTQQQVMVRTESPGTQFPVVDIDGYNIEEGLKSCGYSGPWKISGVLSLEHVGRHGISDGMCVSVLVQATSCQELESRDYKWSQVDQHLEEKLRERLQSCAELFL